MCINSTTYTDVMCINSTTYSDVMCINSTTYSDIILSQVSIELLKVVSGHPLESYKNAFLNLALPSLVFSEPAPPARTVVRYTVKPLMTSQS